MPLYNYAENFIPYSSCPLLRFTYIRYYHNNIIIIIQYSMNLYNSSLTATVRLEYLNNFLRSAATGRVYKSEPRYSGELLLLNCDRNSGPRPRHLCGYRRVTLLRVVPQTLDKSTRPVVAATLRPTANTVRFPFVYYYYCYYSRLYRNNMAY